MLTRLSIRARITAAFAAALLLVFTLAGLFVYDRVGRHLNNTINDGLASQSADLGALLSGSHPLRGAHLVAHPDEGFSQILTPRGRVVESTLPLSVGSTIPPLLVAQAAQQRVIRDIPTAPGVDGSVRVLARPATHAGKEVVLVVGRSTDDRTETLTELRKGFVIGLPLALLLACGIGYFVAGRAFAPVRAMQRRAKAITLEQSEDRLPLPRANDEIHQLGETLNTMLDRIEVALVRERVFVADASHELRTPLATLSAELELANRPGRSPDELQGAVRSAKEEVDRLSRLAEDLLVIARSDTGRLPIDPEPVELRPMLERVRDRLAGRAAEQEREIVVDSPAGVTAELDPRRIEQALGNLVDNALRHGRGDVRLSAQRDNGSVVLAVADNGEGFSPEFADQAFERFTREQQGRSGGGAGLGLAIVRAIAIAHGGEVVVEPKSDGSPTTLRMTLPLESQEAV